jgi:hypothetical protein
MLAIIILTVFAVATLIIGFLDIRLPFVPKNDGISLKEKNIAKEPSKSLESFYRTIRVESWLNKIREQGGSSLESVEGLHKTVPEFI